jgi:poly(hydroxyalkanoate) depolymerase family esterase
MINTAMAAGMREATRLTRSGQLHEAVAMIQRTLKSQPMEVDAGEAVSAADATGETIEGSCRVHDGEQVAASPSLIGHRWQASRETGKRAEQSAETRAEESQHAPAASSPRPFVTVLPGAWRDTLSRLAAPGALSPLLSDPVPDREPVPGLFTTGTYTNHAGTRHYKLYIPSGYDGQPLPLVVMLHGCTQDPDDFATGTRMNRLAEEQPCFVLYPAQPTAANSSKCWNWFKASDQQREQGEPAIIAGLTRHILAEHGLDPQRVYVAGLSAGGAMATTLAMTYPDLYAAVGVHSGLPHGVAQSLPDALGAMQGGSGPLAVASSARASRWASGVPAVVFHGDRDTTVHPGNADRVVAQYAASRGTGESANDREGIPGMTVERGRVPDGYAYTRTRHHDADGQSCLEQWVIHGAGHAWSGGDARGSHTDPKGPDAAREMLRFFQSHANSADQTVRRTP